MRLAGDADLIRDVRFKLGKHQVRRDTQAPFEQTLARRTLRRTRATSLRAVVYPHDRGTPRVILSRTLPRCGLRR
jgi:hypothetical protein